MRRASWANIAALTVAVVLALLTTACDNKPENLVRTQGAPTDEASLFQVPENQMAHLKIAEVRKSRLVPTVRTPA